MKIEIDLPELVGALEGFEYTGEYREPKEGDWYLDSYNDIAQAVMDHEFGQHPILKPVEKWIVPTLEYMQENYKWGETVEARFKDDELDRWHTGELTFMKNGVYTNINSITVWNFCEIKVKP